MKPNTRKIFKILSQCQSVSSCSFEKSFYGKLGDKIFCFADFGEQKFENGADICEEANAKLILPQNEQEFSDLVKIINGERLLVYNRKIQLDLNDAIGKGCAK